MFFLKYDYSQNKNVKKYMSMLKNIRYEKKIKEKLTQNFLISTEFVRIISIKKIIRRPWK